MSYAILRVAKVHSIGAVQMHNERKFKNSSNMDIDREKTKDNFHHKSCDCFYSQKIDEIIEKGLTAKTKTGKEKTVRKNAVKSVEVLMTSDYDFFRNIGKEDTKKYFDVCYEFCKREYGENNIVSSVVHYDEKSPHMHLVFVPIRDGKLNAFEVLGGRKDLSELQDRFHAFVNENGFELERGRENINSLTHHKDLKTFKRETIQAEIELTQLNNELEHSHIQFEESDRVLELTKKELKETIEKSTQTLENAEKIKTNFENMSRLYEQLEKNYRAENEKLAKKFELEFNQYCENYKTQKAEEVTKDLSKLQKALSDKQNELLTLNSTIGTLKTLKIDLNTENDKIESKLEMHNKNLNLAIDIEYQYSTQTRLKEILELRKSENSELQKNVGNTVFSQQDREERAEVKRLISQGHSLSELPKKYREDYEIIDFAVKKDPREILHASESLQNQYLAKFFDTNPEIVQELAIQKMEQDKEKLRNTKNFQKSNDFGMVM